MHIMQTIARFCSIRRKLPLASLPEYYVAYSGKRQVICIDRCSERSELAIIERFMLPNIRDKSLEIARHQTLIAISMMSQE